MLILLPPSEGKTDPGEGPKRSKKAAPLDLSALSAPSLTPFRKQVVRALATECQTALANPTKLAALRKRLGLPSSMDHEVVRNAELLDAPAYAAYKVYTGVLFAAADFGSLTAAERRTANSRVRIASALFGFVSLADKIPPYRLNADAQLASLGSPKTAIKKTATMKTATMKNRKSLTTNPTKKSLMKKSLTTNPKRKKTSKMVMMKTMKKNPLLPLLPFAPRSLLCRSNVRC